jgi:putative DNA primase/helicase
LPAMDRIAWNRREVYIAFDSDISTNENVQDAEARLAAHLANRGAKVRVVRIPEGPPGPDGKPSKVGLDDFIVAQGIGALRKLLDEAEEPTPPSAINMKAPASDIDAVPEAGSFLETTKSGGLLQLRFWKGSFWRWSRGAYAELPLAEVRAQLVTHLDKSFSKLTTTSVGNVLEGVRAKSILSYCTMPPAWIGDKPEPWPVDELLATESELVHLPSLVSGTPNYVIPATPQFFTTAALDFTFTARAPKPEKWFTFLTQVWPDDSGSISTLQEWMGYTLTPDTRQQKILLVVGPKRSGKGTIARVIRSLIGPANVCGPTLASLAGEFGLWPLLGKSLAIISDARLGGRTDAQVVVERLLSISGEDALDIARKCLDSIPATKLTTRLMILSNEIPRLADSSEALASRMVVLRLTKSFLGLEDLDLTAKLQTELPGILLWAIEGWRRLRERGRFEQPESSRELIDSLADLSSPVGAFVRERCLVGPGFRAAVDNLFEEWKMWCATNGRREPGTIQTFARDLMAAVPTLHRVQLRDGEVRYRAYYGIGLKAAW